MGLMQDWRDQGYDQNADKTQLQKMWEEYFLKEKDIYVQLLSDPDTEVKGTIKELAEKYGVDVMTMTGFLDGIDESLKDGVDNNIEDLSEDSVVSLAFDKAKLYKNMIAAKADWLYNLKEWEAIYSKEEREELAKEQKRSQTFVREGEKVYPNDPCPCGSGKKYKKCCMKTA